MTKAHFLEKWILVERVVLNDELNAILARHALHELISRLLGACVAHVDHEGMANMLAFRRNHGELQEIQRTKPLLERAILCAQSLGDQVKTASRARYRERIGASRSAQQYFHRPLTFQILVYVAHGRHPIALSAGRKRAHAVVTKTGNLGGILLPA